VRQRPVSDAAVIGERERRLEEYADGLSQGRMGVEPLVNQQPKSHPGGIDSAGAEGLHPVDEIGRQQGSVLGDGFTEFDSKVAERGRMWHRKIPWIKKIHVGANAMPGNVEDNESAK